MKRGWVSLLVLIVVGGGLAVGWWWARTAPEAATDLLVGGGLERTRAEQFVSKLGGRAEAESEAAALVASGSIEGVEVAIVSEFGGRIVRLEADAGWSLAAGQAVVELDDRQLQAQMAEARAAVAAAEANLAAVEAGTHPAEILAARAALGQAEAVRDAALVAWQDALAILENPQVIDVQITQAEAQLAMARAAIETAEAQVAASEVERDRYAARGTADEKWLYQVYSYQAEAARYGLTMARADESGARENLAALRAVRENPLALVSAVHLAESSYRIAESGVAVAEAKLAELQAGPMPEEVRVAAALVAQAEAGVAGLQAQIEKMVLTAPIGGIVTSLSAHEGEAVLPGATLLTVANLDELRLTIYVPETQLGRVTLGQEAGVTVDAYPGRVFAGTVSYISQQAEFTPKNVQTEEERVNMVFAVKVRLTNPGHLLKPGMPADATLR